MYISNKNLFYENIDSEEIIFVVFYAEWCKPSKKYFDFIRQTPKIDKNTYLFDIDREPELINIFSLKSTPSTLLYYQGRLIEQYVGVPTKEIINKKLKKNKIYKKIFSN